MKMEFMIKTEAECEDAETLQPGRVVKNEDVCPRENTGVARPVFDKDGWKEKAIY
jgi:hypothetical protein